MQAAAARTDGVTCELTNNCSSGRGGGKCSCLGADPTLPAAAAITATEAILAAARSPTTTTPRASYNVHAISGI